MLLIDRELRELEDDTKCAFLLKLTKLVKKSSNLTRIGKKKLHCPISHSFTNFVESIRWPYFSFEGDLMSLTNSLAIDGVKLRKRKVAVSFFE